MLIEKNIRQYLNTNDPLISKAKNKTAKTTLSNHDNHDNHDNHFKDKNNTYKYRV